MKTKLLNVAVALLSLSVVTGCGKKDDSADVQKANDSVPLVFASQELDGVFNPFYYTSGADGNIIGMTQISMFTTAGKDGHLAYGKDEPVAVLDYEQKQNADDTTTYTFVLKNPESKVKFSNGSYLTMQDVLFNLYEYLDPSYTGSSTMYSTDIVGLAAYRTQQATEAGQKMFEEKFTQSANTRVNDLVNVIDGIKKDYPSGLTESMMKEKLALKATSNAGDKNNHPYASNYVADFDYIGETFKEELYTDYKNNMDSYADYGLSSDVQTFLYVEGLITIDLDKKKDDPERIDYAGFDELAANWTMDDAVNAVYDAYFVANFDQIANYWQTATTIRNTFTSDAKEAYFKENTDMPYKNIEGIKVLKENTTVNGKNYNWALYNSDGSKKDGSDNGYEMLSITINGVDPKAIWNFSFSVAPMYYYSNADQIAKFDYKEHFGVEYASSNFQNKTIKDPSKIGVPVGAGPYKAANKNNTDAANAGEFLDSNVVYYVRNDNYLMGSPKIKMIRYKVVSTNNMLNSLEQGEVHYCEPSAKQEIINQINSKEGIDYKIALTLGYGYIGINAGEVPSVYARRAIMSTMNTKLTLEYYPGYAEILYRPMSKVSWAYPKGATEYESIAYDMTGQKAIKLLKQAGYTQNSQGLMVNKEGKQLKLTFTIAGDTDDHPAAQTFYKSQSILNSIGCDITVKTDNDALKKLSTGSLTVWAAAWSTTIDPDMYQSYHKDSTATSTLNWGYDDIKADTSGATYSYEQNIINELSDKIDAGRETLDQAERTDIYAECLDLVMDLAVELPTYQRSDLFAYNSNVIDSSTLTPDSEIGPYNGPINQIWNLSLKASALKK